MRRFAPVLALTLACGPDAPAGTEGATTGTTGTTSTDVPTAGDPSTTTDTTAAPTTTEPVPGTTSTGDDDSLEQHGPCPIGDECELCVQSEGASVCGPQCPEYGPGPAAGRCPESSVQWQSICPLDHVNNAVPPVCLIMCEDTADCPDPGMICVTCPEPFVSACNSLWVYSETGPNICAWPGT